MIVSKSGQLQPNSHKMKERFEEVLRTPTVQQQYNEYPSHEPAPTPQPETQAPPGPVQPVSIEQAARELAQTEASPSPVPVSNDQLEFDLSEPTKLDQLLKLAKQQNLLLEEISLKLDNGKRAKSTKKR